MKNSSAYAVPANLTTIAGKLHVSFEGTLPVALRSAAHGCSRAVAATAISSLAAWCVTSMLGMCFDWGYENVKTLFGQPDSMQSVVAAMALWFLVMPFSFALTFGYVKQTLNGPRFWSLMPGVVVALAATADFVIESDWSAAVEMVPWTFLATMFAYCGYFAGQVIMQKTRTPQARRLIAAGIVSCVPAGLLSALSINLSFQSETAFCIATTLAAVIFVAHRSVDPRLSSRLQLVGLSMVPLLFPLAMNIVFGALSLFLDQFGIGAELGWRALLSASALFLFAVGTCIAGSIIAHLSVEQPREIRSRQH